MNDYITLRLAATRARERQCTAARRRLATRLRRMARRSDRPLAGSAKGPAVTAKTRTPRQSHDDVAAT